MNNGQFRVLKFHFALALIFSSIAVCAPIAICTPIAGQDLQKRIDDKNGASAADFWIYNDINKAREIALKENKPMFVTFRCVPCANCKAFDAEVAKGNEGIAKMAREKFISVRQVEMKGVDLSLFEFDHDLNWAAMFINADGTVYARYGTQSAEGPDAYNSIEGLLTTMNRVLEIHKNYPKNKSILKGKRRSQKPKFALDLPGLKNAEKLALVTTRSNCIHCHTIHDAAHFDAKAKGQFKRDMLWKYPLPDNVGMRIDRITGNTISSVLNDSPAAKSGLKKGDEIKTVNGQLITSIADIQWVLHGLSNQAAKVTVETSKGRQHTISLGQGWKEYDFSWRGSIYSVSPILRVWLPNVEQKRLDALGVDDKHTAFLVKWINNGTKAGKAAIQSGLRYGDVVVELDGKPIKKMNPQQFNTFVKLNYKVGQSLPLTVVRKGKRVKIDLKLVE